jgi:hypothetical protein
MLLNFAVLAACYDKRIDEVQTWRHDAPQFDTEEIRADACVYLALLGQMGYPLAPVEQAIITGEHYTPRPPRTARTTPPTPDASLLGVGAPRALVVAADVGEEVHRSVAPLGQGL